MTSAGEETGAYRKSNCCGWWSEQEGDEENDSKQREGTARENHFLRIVIAHKPEQIPLPLLAEY